MPGLSAHLVQEILFLLDLVPYAFSNLQFPVVNTCILEYCSHLFDLILSYYMLLECILCLCFF